MVDGVLTGYVGLKAPGKNIDPASFVKKSHEYRQWQRLRNLPNLLYTNGTEWRLYRYGSLYRQARENDNAVNVSAGSFIIRNKRVLFPEKKITWSAPADLATLFLNSCAGYRLLATSADRLVETLAPWQHCTVKMLVSLTAQEKTDASKRTKGEKGEEDEVTLPKLVGLRKDWRDTLAPIRAMKSSPIALPRLWVFSLVVVSQRTSTSTSIPSHR